MWNKITTGILIAVIAYFAFCIGEIEVKNVRENPNYSNWNIIVNLCGGGNK